ncbi:hypothetical protein LTR08_001119 [Meristemomyces frigidus]|nr:hypothetical protein LTR08_001119 [Meristemomyces frigidus]
MGCGSLLLDRMEETPPLPDGWSATHDRAICVLDARNYPISTIVARVRRAFPWLQGVLTTAMVDKRLRQLDQDIEIDYWRVGLQGTKNALPGLTTRTDSGSVLIEDMAYRRPGPPPKDSVVPTSLAKSPSVANMLPDTISLSTEPSRTNVTSQFATSQRTKTTRGA